MARFPADLREPGGLDPLDARVADAGVAAPPVRGWRLQTRLALGLSPSALPSLLLLLLGFVIGPRGLGLLSANALASLDPAMPVALTALGVLIGLGFNIRKTGERRLLAAASVEAGTTLTLVAAGALVLAPIWSLAPDVPVWFVAATLGICASASSTAVSRSPDRSRAQVARIGDLDDVLPVAAGGVALAFLRESAAGPAALLLLESVAVALVIGVAGWLLLARSTSEIEQRVYIIALLLLLGGAAEYLSLSALVSGMLAGMFWEGVGGPARDRVRRDVLHIQHPVIVLVLVVTGARVDVPTGWLGMGLAYLFLRTAGKLAGGWLARRIVGTSEIRDVGLSLLSPGIVGIAFALNAMRAGGPDVASVLTIVVIGAAGSEAVAAFVKPRGEVE